MDSNEYQYLAGRTLIDKPDFVLSPEETMLVWNTLGLCGEAGEFAELVKKLVFHKHQISQIKLAEELGDVLWYVAAICSRLGLSMSDVMQANVEKLKKRYPEGYSQEASVRRQDEATSE